MIRPKPACRRVLFKSWDARLKWRLLPQTPAAVPTAGASSGRNVMRGNKPRSPELVCRAGADHEY
jgi:hypothetical protein